MAVKMATACPLYAWTMSVVISFKLHICIIGAPTLGRYVWPSVKYVDDNIEDPLPDNILEKLWNVSLKVLNLGIILENFHPCQLVFFYDLAVCGLLTIFFVLSQFIYLFYHSLFI